MKELYHYGIPGMRWGVRRAQEVLDRLAGRSANKREKVSSDERIPMNDEELRVALNRKRMEREYETLSKPLKSDGRKYAQMQLEKAGGIVVAGIAGFAVKQAMDYVKNKWSKK